jgi:hypothetical protein
MNREVGFLLRIIPLVVLLIADGMVGSADAQRKWSNWSITWENDSFVPPGVGSDEFYTNGVRLSIARDEEYTWDWAEWLGKQWRRTPFIGEAPYAITSALVLGQNFFTPTVITEFEPNSEDRPYAALLYLGGRVDVTEDDDPGERGFKFRMQHTFEFDLGVIGPPALAEETQKAVHLLRQSRIPKGWGHQLGTELAVNAIYLPRAKVGWHFLDAVPHLAFALGTVQTYASAGAMVRAGWNMSGFPSLLIPWTVAPVNSRPSYEIAFFAGVDGRIFARNAYLDGNLLGGSPRVDKKPGVYDWRWGFSGRIKSFRFTYSFVRRSPEFHAPPDLGERHHNFGSISFGLEYGR